jgi:mRNA interferase RelE/StbE
VKVTFRTSFTRDLRKIRDADVRDKVRSAILSVEQAQQLGTVSNLKKLRGAGGAPYFRIRVGDYRIGLRVDEDTVTFVRVLSRDEIYRHFP